MRKLDLQRSHVSISGVLFIRRRTFTEFYFNPSSWIINLLLYGLAYSIVGYFTRLLWFWPTLRACQNTAWLLKTSHDSRHTKPCNKIYIFTREKINVAINCGSRSQQLLKWMGLVFHWCLYNKQNITWPLRDTKFLRSFEKYFMSERSCEILSTLEKKKSLICLRAPCDIL